MSHDYSTIAREILENLGGTDNLEQAATASPVYAWR